MVKKKMAKGQTVQRRIKEKDPSYMVQISDPKMLRKDLLESLRELIIFMQGYEKFRKIQGQKMDIFTALKADTKELSRLIEVKLKHYFPKGRLAPVREAPKPKALSPHEEHYSAAEATQVSPSQAARKGGLSGELDVLEGQLKDIEGKLKTI